MKKSWIVIIVIVLIILIIFGMFRRTYNNMVTKGEAVTAQWSQVENVYQRRADLIPNLVNTVKGYAEHEQETFTLVTEARANATSVKIDPTNITPEALQQFQAAQDGLSSTLSRLLLVVEAYPDLKANQNFLELQAQLEGTENRIANERMKFNEVTRDYNVYIKRFPQMIFAGMFGFDEKPYFKSEEGAEKAPKVEF